MPCLLLKAMKSCGINRAKYQNIPRCSVDCDNVGTMGLGVRRKRMKGVGENPISAHRLEFLTRELG